MNFEGNKLSTKNPIFIFFYLDCEYGIRFLSEEHSFRISLAVVRML